MKPAPDHRTAAEVRREGNHLRHEASLYLRQHADDPVDWYPWSEEALARARQLGRPIFLSSGYSSCHWCHVMAHEVFAHDDVADLLNARFVSIKVDREELPEVDATYMQAVQLMTGRGGWPMSVFLTPDLQPFFGATYVPRARFRELLERIVQLWDSSRDDIAEQAAALAAHIAVEPAPAGADPAPVTRDLLAKVVDGAARRFDAEHGGFEASMKFPVPVRWTFLLHWYRKTGDPTARDMITTTLEAMARGGLYDHVGGGFHRYTVDPHWTVPHFEKMLYDNAQLATLYLEAGAALERPDFTAVGVDVLEFLDRDMCGEEGAVYASLDADSDGEEGSYYVWTPAQIADVVGPDDGPALAGLLGVTEAGNFERGTSVATRRADPAAVAAVHDRERADLADLFARHRDALRQARDLRPAPALDRKVITGWNGLALTAFARGARATGRDDFRDRAEAIAAYLHRVHRRGDGDLVRASNAGRIAGVAVLEDLVLLARGLLDLFQLTGTPAHLAWADEIVATVGARFARDAGAWYTTAASAAPPLGRRVDVFDNVIPSGCSAMLDVLLTHGALTGDPEAAGRVRRELAQQAAQLPRAGLEMAGWLDAALRLDGPLHEVVVAGEAGDARFGALWRAAAATLAPGVVVAPVPAAGPGNELATLAPTLADKTAVDGAAAAYVCRHGACQAPTMDALELTELLGEGWVR